MVSLTLARYNLKRIFRYRALKLLLFALPLLFALCRAAFAGNAAVKIAADLCPFVCLLAVSLVLYCQRSTDSASGLLDGLLSCPLPDRALFISRVLAGAVVFAIQMLIFGAILAVRF